MSEFAFGGLDFEDLDQDVAETRRASSRARSRPAGREGPSPESQRPSPRFSPASGERAAPTRRRAAERALGLLLGAAGLALVASAAFVFVPPLCRVSRYEIRGAATLSERDILDAALIHGTEYFFSIEPERMRTALLASPRIATARVRRLFPNGIRIEVGERKAVAAVLAERGGRLESVLIDREGVAFAFASEVAASAKDSGAKAPGAQGPSAKGDAGELPLVSGLRFEGFNLGTRLPANLVPLLVSLGELEAKAPSLLAAFSEIRVVKPKYGDPELLLYPLHHRIPVRSEAVLNEATLRSIILVLDLLGSKGLEDGVEEIDFRRGTVVYRSKEGQSD